MVGTHSKCSKVMVILDTIGVNDNLDIIQQEIDNDLEAKVKDLRNEWV